MRQFDGLAEQHSFIRQAGLNRESINRSVTDQGLDGIFSYIGSRGARLSARTRSAIWAKGSATCSAS